MGTEDKSLDIDTKYIKTLDGVRAFAILLVVGFHFCQQSFLVPAINTPFLKSLGIEGFSSYTLLCTGYEMVDLMILLSGFCLFLPYARAMINGGNTDSILTFYKKRAARIFPSYYFCILIFFLYALITKAYGTTAFMWKDLLTHMTFTSVFSNEVYTATQLNPVLWTINIEVLFYLIFPFIAKAFQKKPLLTWGSMVIVAELFIRAIALPRVADNIVFLHILPCYLSVFANGMMAALFFVALAKYLKRYKYVELFFTGLCIVSMLVIYYYLNKGLLSAPNGVRTWQLSHRTIMSALFGFFVISVSLSVKWLRFIFENRVTKFLAAISMNLYIWHQQLAVKFKLSKFPAWPCESNPESYANNREWQIKYTIVIVISSIAVAVIVTYLIEKPLAGLILGKNKKKLLKRQNSKLGDGDDEA